MIFTSEQGRKEDISAEGIHVLRNSVRMRILDVW